MFLNFKNEMELGKPPSSPQKIISATVALTSTRKTKGFSFTL